MLFWPQFPHSAETLRFASAEQGSARGDFAIAWKFEDLPEDESQYDSAVVSIVLDYLSHLVERQNFTGGNSLVK
jgi:uncharacterized protein YcnI